ncbi:hypothetical protein ACS0TY_014576 [Phlomoides rotata]
MQGKDERTIPPGLQSKMSVKIEGHGENDESLVRRLWGRGKIDWASKAVDGNSGGLLSIWNAERFQKSNVWEIRDMLINTKDACVGIIEDFNAIREPSERCGKRQGTDRIDMEKFNDFIQASNLLEIQLIGMKLMWYRPDGTCKTKLDRLLVNDEWRAKWPNQILRGGKRTLSDHRPIYTEETHKDWGPKPFKMYNWWLSKQSFMNLVEKNGRSTNSRVGARSD